MAAVTLSKDEFIEFLIAFLLDKMMKSDEIYPNHEVFNDLIKDLKSKNVQQNLLYYYLNSSAIIRGKYNFIRNSLTSGNEETLAIYIRGDVDPVKVSDNTEIIKKVVKKALKMIKAHRQRKGFPLSEEKVDKIIEKVLLEEQDKEK